MRLRRSHALYATGMSAQFVFFILLAWRLWALQAFKSSSLSEKTRKVVAPVPKAYHPGNEACTDRLAMRLNSYCPSSLEPRYHGNNSVYITEHYGRLGNRINALVHLIDEATMLGCDIEITDILEGWHPIHELFINIASNKTTNLPCSGRRGEELYNRNFSLLDSEGVTTSVRQILSYYFLTNSTHALGEACSEMRYAAVHIRSGDISAGVYSSDGHFEPQGIIHSGYGPYPTSFFVTAVSTLISKYSKVVVICETESNPSCLFFSKLRTLMASIDYFSGRPLLEDARVLLCASEVVVSRSTLKNLLLVSERLIKLHEFKRAGPAVCGRTRWPIAYYYFKDEKDCKMFERDTAVWKNTDYQRNLIDMPYHILVRTCT